MFGQKFWHKRAEHYRHYLCAAYAQRDSTFQEATTNAYLNGPRIVGDIPIGASTAVSITETQGGASTASTLYMGNWSRLWFGFRNEVRVELLRELFRANLQVGFMVWLRVDVALEHPQSFGGKTHWGFVGFAVYLVTSVHSGGGRRGGDLPVAFNGASHADPFALGSHL